MLLHSTPRALLLGLFACVALATDPFLGTWKLDISKSKFSLGPTPKSKIRVYEAVPEGTKVSVTTIEADGKTSHVEIVAKEDLKTYAVRGDGPYQEVSPERIDDHTVTSVLRISEKVTVASMRVVSHDGKKMTLTSHGTDEQGQPIHQVETYFRVPNAAGKAP